MRGIKQAETMNQAVSNLRVMVKLHAPYLSKREKQTIADEQWEQFRRRKASARRRAVRHSPEVSE